MSAALLLLLRLLLLLLLRLFVRREESLVLCGRKYSSALLLLLLFLLSSPLLPSLPLFLFAQASSGGSSYTTRVLLSLDQNGRGSKGEEEEVGRKDVKAGDL